MVIITQGAITTSFGPVTGGWQMRKRAQDEHTGGLPPFLVAESLKGYISSDLRTLVSTPRRYKGEFTRLLNSSLPKYGDTLDLLFNEP